MNINLNTSTHSNKIKKTLRSSVDHHIKMAFNPARLRVKELAEALSIDSAEIIATCTLLKIQASSPLSSLSIEQSKAIIDYIQKDTSIQN